MLTLRTKWKKILSWCPVRTMDSALTAVNTMVVSSFSLFFYHCVVSSGSPYSFRSTSPVPSKMPMKSSTSVLTIHCRPAAPSCFVLAVSTRCNLQSLKGTNSITGEPYWLCQRQDTYCVENQTCESVSEPPARICDRTSLLSVVQLRW